MGYEKNFKLASAWLEVSEQLPDEKNEYSEIAIDLFQKALLLNPYKWKEALKIALQYFPKEDVVKKVLPPPGTSTKMYSVEWLDKFRMAGIRWLEMQR